MKVDKIEDDLPWIPYALSPAHNLHEYPNYPLRTGVYFERMCRLSEVSRTATDSNRSTDLDLPIRSLRTSCSSSTRSAEDQNAAKRP